MDAYKYDISIVIPLYNEDESLPELAAWFDKVCRANEYSYEAIMIDDGSSDNSWELVKKLSKQYPSIKGIRFRRNYGKSAALNVGFENAQGRVVITMDADLQDSPYEIPELYNLIVKDGFDLISGWKKNRKDSFVKNKTSKVYNFFARKMTGIRLNDMNCGLKAYRYEVVKSIEVYGEMHRYIPVIAKWAGFGKIGEKVVSHQARKYGVTKFGLERFVNGFLDLGTIVFTTRFGKKPMHLFGVLGLLMFMVGSLFLGWAIIDKLFIDTTAKLLAQRTEFFLALGAVILGVQFFLAGFIAELISRNAADRNIYQVSERVNS